MKKEMLIRIIQVFLKCIEWKSTSNQYFVDNYDSSGCVSVFLLGIIKRIPNVHRKILMIVDSPFQFPVNINLSYGTAELHCCY